MVPPTSGIYSGPQWSQKIGDGFRSLAGCNKGPTAPANVGGSTVDGLCWIDDSATPWIMKRYISGTWVVEGAYDTAGGTYLGVIGGGVASLASGLWFGGANRDRKDDPLCRRAGSDEFLEFDRARRLRPDHGGERSG
jgi:hypothetical protein